MGRNTLRSILLICCLVAAMYDAFVLKHFLPRLVLGVVLLASALIAMRATRVSGEEDEEEVVQSRSLRLPGRRTAELLAAMDELREDLETQQAVTAELAMKLGHHDGLRAAMWKTLDGRLTQVETTQTQEGATLREANGRHHDDVDKLRNRMETHKRALAALTDVLAPVAPAPASVAPAPAPVAPAPAPDPAPAPEPVTGPHAVPSEVVTLPTPAARAV